MTPPLLTQRSRDELIADLYDRHAAGLFAYCRDQLGDPETAGATVLAVLTAVSSVEPPRAALYALARREFARRDVVYSPPLSGTSPGADPVTAFVERVLRDLRPHQREVLYLSGVREMDVVEMSWVLDVAADTADELTVSACQRFAQALTLALSSARVPARAEEAFGALAVAPIRDVLARAPWAVPPASLRAAVLASCGAGTAPAPRPASAAGASLQVRPLWPTAPAWPSSPAGTGAPAGHDLLSPRPAVPASPSPAAFDAFTPRDPSAFDAFTPRDPDAVSAHEATTEPMPKLRDAVLSALDEAAPPPRRPRLQRPRPRVEMPLSAPIPADILESNPPRLDYPPLDDLFRPLSKEQRAALAYTDKLVASAPRGTADGTPRKTADDAQATGTAPHGTAEAVTPSDAAGDSRVAGNLETASGPETTGASRAAGESETAGAFGVTGNLAAAGTSARSGVLGNGEGGEGEGLSGSGGPGAQAGGGIRRRDKPAKAKHGEHHYDWIWELIGFLICVAIALIVFFAVPSVSAP
ncbi:hypothetical protein [Planobispora longispora]|uniref:hypothetical protein n=1 Tax=Planobispora longispora TaxID=28887 RepID=UPI00361F9623